MGNRCRQRTFHFVHFGWNRCYFVVHRYFPVPWCSFSSFLYLGPGTPCCRSVSILRAHYLGALWIYMSLFPRKETGLCPVYWLCIFQIGITSYECSYNVCGWNRRSSWRAAFWRWKWFTTVSCGGGLLSNDDDLNLRSLFNRSELLSTFIASSFGMEVAVSTSVSCFLAVYWFVLLQPSCRSKSVSALSARSSKAARLCSSRQCRRVLRV